MTSADLTSLGATDLAATIRDGQHSSEEVVDAHLARIAEVDGQIEAWAFLDPDHARAQAKHADMASAVRAARSVRCMACRWA